MKKNVIITILMGAFLMTPCDASAQFLKKLGAKLKSAVEKTIGVEGQGNSDSGGTEMKSLGDLVDESGSVSKQSNDEEVYDTPKGIFKPIKPIYEEEDGWQLVYEEDVIIKGVGNVTAKHHEKGDEAVRTYLFKDGSFISFLEDENANYHMAPRELDDAVGTYKLVFKDGSHVEGQIFKNAYEYDPGRFVNLNFFKYYFTNGNMYHGFNDFSGDWMFLSKYQENEDLLKDNGMIDFNADDQINRGYRKYFVPHENPTKSYRVHNKDQVYMGDRGYVITRTGWPIAFCQKVGNKYYYANSTDTIVSVQNDVIRYSNGDEITMSEINHDTHEIELLGSIHRNGGVLTTKKVNGKTRIRLTMPNGDFYTGNFKEFTSSGWEVQYFPYNALQHRELNPYNGTWNRGGKLEEFIEGRSRVEVERQQAAEAAKQKAEVKAYYDKICKEYGKKYVDAALMGNVIVGMPEKLFTGSFKTQKVRTSGVSTLYEVYGFGVVDGFDGITLSNSVLQMSVWVSQGRVTDVRHW